MNKSIWEDDVGFFKSHHLSEGGDLLKAKAKASVKYKSRKKVNGKWVYDYVGDTKRAETKRALDKIDKIVNRKPEVSEERFYLKIRTPSGEVKEFETKAKTINKAINNFIHKIHGKVIKVKRDKIVAEYKKKIKEYSDSDAAEVSRNLRESRDG